VFFCSRTHSQLSQFVSELHRTPFAETLSVVAIAGRKVWCPIPWPAHIHSQGPKSESLSMSFLGCFEVVTRPFSNPAVGMMIGEGPIAGCRRCA
jgi:hypothetical protein